MTTGTHRIDVAPARRPGAPWIALLLAVLSLPGSLLPWAGLAWGGVVNAGPRAVAAPVGGLRAGRDPAATASGRRVATAAAVLAVAVLLIPVVWTLASLLS